jgi:hypothetical protein
VVGRTFPDAFARLRWNGVLVAVPAFPRLAAWSLVNPLTLANHRVTRATRLALRRCGRTWPSTRRAASAPVIRSDKPPGITVPDVVGQPDTTAMTIQSTPGLDIALGRIGPLPAASSARALDAFVVVQESPPAGSIIPAFGVSVPDGSNLGPSTVNHHTRPPGTGDGVTP